MISVIVCARRMKLKFAAIRKADLALMSKADAVKLAEATGLSKLKCISFRMFMYLVKFAKGNVITVKRWRSNIKGKSIADLLGMTIEDACEFFKNVPRIHRKMQTLFDVGLGYMNLGQPATTLSGGEAQRVKLAAELYRTQYRQDHVYSG